MTSSDLTSPGTSEMFSWLLLNDLHDVKLLEEKPPLLIIDPNNSAGSRGGFMAPAELERDSAKKRTFTLKTFCVRS